MDITAAGVLLADDDGALRRSAASSRKALLLQQFQVQTEQGPGVDCFRTGRSVSAENLPADDRWPHFAAAADAGFTAVHTVAMRRRAQTVGALSFHHAARAARTEFPQHRPGTERDRRHRPAPT